MTKQMTEVTNYYLNTPVFNIKITSYNHVGLVHTLIKKQNKNNVNKKRELYA